MEKQKSLTPAETSKAEEMATRLEAAMTRAEFEVMIHEQDLIAAGVSAQQIRKCCYKCKRKSEIRI